MAAIWAASLMLEQLGESEAAALVMRGVEHVAANGPRTKDLGGSARTTEIGDAVDSFIRSTR
jgi:tartrate dehydrogenase/decarboxylase/D-malate dehydrogenase